MKETEDKGITLIALVVSIIILIILAGVSLNLLLRENGIIVRTREKKIQQRLAQVKDHIEL